MQRFNGLSKQMEGRITKTGAHQHHKLDKVLYDLLQSAHYAEAIHTPGALITSHLTIADALVAHMLSAPKQSRGIKPGLKK